MDGTRAFTSPRRQRKAAQAAWCAQAAARRLDGWQAKAGKGVCLGLGGASPRLRGTSRRLGTRNPPAPRGF